MARPKVELPDAGAIRALADADGRLAVRVTPGAREETVAIVDGRVLVKVRAKPEDGKATTAVLSLVAAALGVAASRVELLRGATSREKLLRLPPAA
ncbi:hypothetical protein Y88_2102 [Novosphingobium nitrogenifigens DSM 19370]|jgi:uncharacterized protein YggU (UPF0235/DUF167 family)|uniref:UPF0235 protein Y88_2102 n=1 Tax=Novosphingobium nitrogenifigens DSM 19370 TaxID=983920 RepID=F1Z5W8_9SPHN|nr:DUF167 domain-containing protein [Novosphingobium nitrogenifigens]EGD60228.1 hypothetical protein Y88_2102 [Novosphingobium nitrogenifigens DSM 19370]